MSCGTCKNSPCRHKGLVIYSKVAVKGHMAAASESREGSNLRKRLIYYCIRGNFLIPFICIYISQFCMQMSYTKLSTWLQLSFPASHAAKGWKFCDCATSQQDRRDIYTLIISSALLFHPSLLRGNTQPVSETANRETGSNLNKKAILSHIHGTARLRSACLVDKKAEIET